MSQTKNLVTRRALLSAGAGSVLISVLPGSAHATTDSLRMAIREEFGDTPIKSGRVSLEIPPIAENGYSVPLEISVDSPMTNDDYVKSVMVLSPVNPLARIARFHLGPHAGRANVSTRIRLGGTQELLVIAEMSDGSLWSGTASTVVTLAACVIL